MQPIQVRVLELLRLYGHETISFQVLEPGLRYWFDDDACIAYADTGSSWVTAGAPITHPERTAAVMQRFAEAAREARRRPRFFGIEQDMAGVAPFRVLQIGEQPVWNPQQWTETLRQKRSLREQLRRSRAAGVSVRMLEPHELDDRKSVLRQAIDRLAARWIANLPMAPMGFVVTLDLYNLPEERRFWIAEHRGSVVGVLIAVPIYRRNGWFLEDVFRDPTAPNGTVESMFDHAMRTLAAAGSFHVTYGLAPLSGTPHLWLQRVSRWTRWLYDFEGLRAFKAKLSPTSWHPVYLCHPADERGLRALVDVLTAFAGGSLMRFGWETLVHRIARVRIAPGRRASREERPEDP